MTERLYYHDSHTVDFSARVVEWLVFGEHPAVVLDRTYFYPTGGGQPHDAGFIEDVAVLDVQTREDDHAVLHILDGDVDGDEVACRIDWAQRLDHMQHHTGQHILTQAFVQIAGAQTIGFHLGSDVVTIDLDKVDLPLRQVGETEDLANQIIVDDRPVTIHIIDPDEADHVRMRRMPDQLLTGGLRVIEVEDFDTTACGGTHVARTGEIGLLKILRLEAKGDGTRVEFLCGGRALADYREKHDILTGLAADLTTGYRDVPDSLDKLRSELKNGQKALKRATEQLVIYEAEHLLAAAEQHGDVRVVKAAPETFDAGDLRALASRLIEAGGVVALLGIPGEASQLLFARSADLPYDMNPAIRAAFAALGEGRGGGRPEFVQGGGAAATAAQLMNAFAAAETNLFETDS